MSWSRLRTPSARCCTKVPGCGDCRCRGGRGRRRAISRRRWRRRRDRRRIRGQGLTRGHSRDKQMEHGISIRQTDDQGPGGRRRGRNRWRARAGNPQIDSLHLLAGAAREQSEGIVPPILRQDRRRSAPNWRRCSSRNWQRLPKVSGGSTPQLEPGAGRRCCRRRRRTKRNE